MVGLTSHVLEADRHNLRDDKVPTANESTHKMSMIGEYTAISINKIMLPAVPTVA